MAIILCYGDSLTWGAIPGGGRYQKNHRWPELLNKRLGEEHDVINSGLPSRTTIWDDPFNDGRNGLKYIQSMIETFAPVNLVILMLGTNDIKSYINASAYDAARGIEKLITKIREPSRHGFPNPEIIVVAPPNIIAPKGEAAEMFPNAVEKMQKFHQEYQKVATRQRCEFLNAAGVITPSDIDGVHLEQAANETLARVLEPLVNKILYS
ncbi:arylesterase [Marinomonas agarivorans]|nr:arylesterase [Marinomonas agarivorans]